MPLNVSGGRSLGQAAGSININTSPARKAVGEMRTIGRDIGRAMSPASQGVDDFIGRFRDGRIRTFARGVQQSFGQMVSSIKSGARSVGQNLDRMGAGIRSLRGELFALGAGAAILTKIGLGTAASLEESQIILEDMVGSQKEANILMDSLRKQANRAGIPFGDLLDASRRLLPTLNRNTAELERWIPIVRRVATLNRQEGISGAAFAINEALSSGGTDLVSLAERFNISRVQLREALAQTGGDFAAALDLVLNRMGVLNTTADRMGETFGASLNRARDAASQLLAAGFQPLLQALTPILQRTADWLNRLRELNPEVVKIGGGLVAAVAAGTPFLLFLGQVLETMQKIKALGLAQHLAKLGPLLGQVAVLGGAAIVGGNIGLQVGRGIGRATGNEQVANTTFQDVATTFKRVVFVVAAAISGLSAKIVSGVTRAVGAFVGGIGNMLGAIAQFVKGIGDFLGPILGQQFQRDAAALEAFSNALGRGQQALDNFANNVEERQQENLRKFGDFLGLTDFGGAGAAGGAAGGAGASALTTTVAPLDLSQFDEQIEQATADYKERVADIEAQANDQRLQATRQYEQQRTSIIAEYNLQRAREAEDFARNRARQEEEFNRQLSDILEERTEREQEWAADLQNRIAEIREDGNERIAEIEEEAARNRERAERDHRLRLFDAARRLDATAVATEQRNFAIQQADAASDVARRLEQERVNLEQRIAQEQEGHVRRLEQARAADEQRIADMVEQFERQKEIEDEERAIALKRQQEDHQRQLEELKRANQEQLKEIQTTKQKELAALQVEHQKQLAEINDAKAKELAAYEEANAKQLNSLKAGQENQLAAQEQGQEQSLDSHRAYWDEANRIAQEAVDNIKNDPGNKNKPTPTSRVVDAQGNPIPGYQHGGPVSDTGLAFLHRGEHVLNPRTTAAIQGMLGNNFNQNQILAAIASGGRKGGGAINFAQGAIQVIAAPGMDAAAVGRAVRGELESLLRSVAGT